MIALFVAVAVLLVAFGGALAAMDAAIAVSSRAGIAELAESGRARKSLLAISNDPEAHINTVNFLRITAETTAAVLITLVFATVFDEVWLALLLSALIMSGVSFVLVGASPRSVGRANSEAVLRLGALPTHGARVLLGPISGALVALGNKVTPGVARQASFDSEEQLLSMVDEAAELDVLEQDDRELIHSIFEFNATLVREIMIPRTDMVTIDAEESAHAAMALFLRTGVSRIPVIDGEVDKVIGVIYLRDVAQIAFERKLEQAPSSVRQMLREAVFVPESMKADKLLRQMQLESTHMAMVVDEYGGIAGLVSLEDLIEELVGDISDEYDREVVEIEELGNGSYRVSARLPVDELGEIFNLELDDDEVDSVGGLLAKALGRLPVTGSRATVAGLILTAERSEGRRKRISTIIVERNRALIDAEEAFLGEATEGTGNREH